MTESILVCEGYHDRAFLRAWLLALGGEDWRDKPYPPHNNRPVRGGGQYVFRSPAGRWVRVVPAGSDGEVIPKADVFVVEAGSRSIDRIVLVWDGDDDSQDGATRGREASFEAWARAKGAVRVEGSVDFRRDATSLSVIVWRASVEHDTTEIPSKQTLERLVCAAIRDIYPERCRAVREWIEARPSPPLGEKINKTHAASHMAGWFSDRGYEGFFDAIWQDPRVREALLRSLAASEASRVIHDVMGVR